MSGFGRLQYLRRIASAYLLRSHSQLNFWHDSTQANARATSNVLCDYYMNFDEKARYAMTDGNGIPQLNYRGAIGLQYNPIAIAQWGLGNFNLFCRNDNAAAHNNFIKASDWLCENLSPNKNGVAVWSHNFDWEYRSTLRAPWYSGLAQGQGISLLVRAYTATNDDRYLECAERAFKSFLTRTDRGGVTFTDTDGNFWFEEYLVSPPTHILNGFIWAAWGVHDYFLATGSLQAKSLFEAAVKTLIANLTYYDLGFWSLYEQSGTRLPMIASPFYHRLHITQLQVMQRLSGETIFGDYADRWHAYARSRSNRTRALCYKGAFKLCYY
ncbi:MAG TPA: D-glucuronyl C5-epimerase family protein [Terriglobales bacterium]